jgi:hypothetical protein
MVLASETRQKTLEEVGRDIGLSIKVLPWWGSVRERKRPVHKKCGMLIHPYNYGRTTFFCPHCQERVEADDTERRYVFSRSWPCPGGSSRNQIKWPEVRNGAIVVWEGPCRARPGRRSRFHNHSQTVEVLDVDGQLILVAIRVSTAWSNFLLGIDDGHPFVRPVKRRETTVQDALDSLVPNKVREAFMLGLDVKRQGDWYFVPVQQAPKLADGYRYVPLSSPGLRAGALYRGAALVYGGQTRHTGGLVVYQSVQGLPYPAPFVRGVVKSPDHPPLRLNGWHMAIRQRRATWNRGQDNGGAD